MLPQENVVELDEDANMHKFFEIVDIISAFKKMHDAWLFNNEDDWYSKELVASIDKIFIYVNQLASYISLHHQDISIEISIDIDSLKGKQFSTVLKRTEEWKVLKKYMKSKHNFSTQTLTVQSLVTVILAEVQLFIEKM